MIFAEGEGDSASRASASYRDAAGAAVRRLMQLTPREHERLLVFTAAELARRRLAEGIPLSHPDAVALACRHGARAGTARRELRGRPRVGARALPPRASSCRASPSCSRRRTRSRPSFGDGSRLVPLERLVARLRPGEADPRRRAGPGRAGDRGARRSGSGTRAGFPPTSARTSRSSARARRSSSRARVSRARGRRSRRERRSASIPAPRSSSRSSGRDGPDARRLRVDLRPDGRRPCAAGRHRSRARGRGRRHRARQRAGHRLREDGARRAARDDREHRAGRCARRRDHERRPARPGARHPQDLDRHQGRPHHGGRARRQPRHDGRRRRAALVVDRGRPGRRPHRDGRGDRLARPSARPAGRRRPRSPAARRRSSRWATAALSTSAINPRGQLRPPARRLALPSPLNLLPLARAQLVERGVPRAAARAGAPAASRCTRTSAPTPSSSTPRSPSQTATTSSWRCMPTGSGSPRRSRRRSPRSAGAASTSTTSRAAAAARSTCSRPSSLPTTCSPRRPTRPFPFGATAAAEHEEMIRTVHRLHPRFENDLAASRGRVRELDHGGRERPPRPGRDQHRRAPTRWAWGGSARSRAGPGSSRT